jgi:hypothetical protein
MFPVRQEREMVIENAGRGHFEMELILSAFTRTEPVPAIDPKFQKEFIDRNMANGIPVVALRFGETGMCLIQVNKDAFEVEEMTRWIGDDIQLNMESCPVNQVEYYREFWLGGYVAHSDRSPTQMLIEGRLKKDDLPFSARIFFVPNENR